MAAEKNKIDQHFKTLQEVIDENTKETERIREENNKLREERDQLYAELQSPTWDMDEESIELNENPESLKVPKMEPFAELLNICSAVKAL